MKLAVRVALIHFAVSLALWFLGRLDSPSWIGPVSYLASLAVFVINPGIVVAREIVPHSMDLTLAQEVTIFLSMTLLTEAMLVVIVLAVQRAMPRAS